VSLRLRRFVEDAGESNMANLHFLVYRPTYSVSYRPIPEVISKFRMQMLPKVALCCFDVRLWFLVILLPYTNPVLIVVQERSRVSPASRGRVPPPQNF